MRLNTLKALSLGGCSLNSESLALRIAELALDRKGLDIVVIDTRQAASYADFLVIVSGTSDRHVTSIAEHIETTLSQENVRARGREGLRAGQWVLVDFGDVVLHVFHEFTRQIYDLEGLWSKAPRLSLPDTKPQHETSHSLHRSPS